MRCDRRPGRLPGELTEFVGRRAELALLRRELSSARLVTLTGPGGIGKTRLAAHAAAEVRRGFREGVWLVELGELSDPALLAAEVARALGLRDQSARWGVAPLSSYLGDRQLLLIADGCEHLDGAFAALAETLLTACPQLRIIATSRHVLGVPGEVTVPVPPMTVPPGRRPECPQDLLQYEAVRLFADRAAAVLPGFKVDAGNAEAVAVLCRGLDGIPLAVELAAGRLRALSPEQIMARLGSRFRLLSSRGQMGGPRDPTLLAALDWSYGLLTGAERSMWRRISVFAGTFNLSAAEAVCAGDEIPREAILDLIDGLMAKSILLRCPGDGEARYRLLNTIRDFGLSKLRSDPGERTLRSRHRGWYARTAARQDAFGDRRVAWIDSLDTDHENLRAALAFSLSEPGEAAAGMELACDLWRYWETRGHLTEGRRIVAALLDQLDETDSVRPRGLWVAGFLALVQGDLEDARVLLETGLAAARRAGDVRAVAYASSQLGYVTYCLGPRGDRRRDDGRALAETGLRLHDELADPVGTVLSLTQIGFIELCSGDLRAAADRFGQCARLAGRCGNLWYEKYARWGVAAATWLLTGDDEETVQVAAALAAARGLDDPVGVALCLDTLAWMAAARKQAKRALTLLGAADAAWAAIPATLPAALRSHHDVALHAASSVVPDHARRAALADGGAMSRDEAVAFALGESPPFSWPETVPMPSLDAASTAPAQLTPRQGDVASLVAEGRSNNEIAAKLFISARTVETHVKHIMDRLGFTARAEIAAWSASHWNG